MYVLSFIATGKVTMMQLTIPHNYMYTMQVLQFHLDYSSLYTELEKFIDANTQKLGENKYLCPLSGKKFRGPDFVRKHIFNTTQGCFGGSQE